MSWERQGLSEHSVFSPSLLAVVWWPFLVSLEPLVSGLGISHSQVSVEDDG